MDNRLSAVRQYIDENRERFYEELFTLLRIPSVSEIGRASCRERV